ncbi:MAG: beta-galactosidase [Kiritimatiellae bacterium]|nr:beta-galactosidase [Kiritimatiellia bacterium]
MMKRITSKGTVVVLVLFVFSQCVAAPLEYTYSIEAPQKVVTKPGILHDGSTKDFAYWKSEEGVVVCELPATAEIAEVVVTLRKVTNWYLMHEVEVALDRDGSGEFTKPKSVPVPIPMYDGKSPVVDASCTNLAMRIPVGAKAVKVKVVVKSHACGALSEIVLDDGKPIPTSARAVTSTPPVVKSVLATKSDIAADRAALPDNLTKVENRYYEMLVSPLGGRVLSLRSKFLDAELTNVKANAGTFTESDWSRGGNKFFYLNKPFTLKPFEGNGICGLEAKGNAQGGGTDFLVIGKKYTLHDDSTALQVDYEFCNLADAMSTQIYGLLLHTTLGINGRLCSYYYPTDEGIVEIERDKRPQERWIHHPSRGWMAAVDDLGRGVALTMPFKDVRAFYSWLAQDAVPTLEWRMIPVSIENGKSYHVHSEVIAFKGLGKVSGAGGGLVGEISDGTVKVFNSRRGKVIARVGDETVELDFAQPGEVRSFASNATTVRLEKDGREVCRLEAPPAKGVWSLAHTEESRKSDMKSFDLTGYTNFPHQVCTAFAKPLAVKRPRVIALTGFGNNVELGFFADRFDCELITSSVGLSHYIQRPQKRKLANPQYDNGDYFGSLSTADVEENLIKTLKKNADAILVGGLPWEIFPKTAQTLILEKVKAGCGLVWIGQDRDAPEIFRTGCLPKMVKSVPVAATRDFADIPFGLLGAEPAYVFAAEGATVHAKAGDAPWLTENVLGKGRILHLPYAAIFGNLHVETGITPNLRDYYPDHVAPVEHYYSLIAKCLLRAANRTMPVSFAHVEVTGKQATCVIAASVAVPSILQWTVRNRFDVVLAKGEMEAALKDGENTLRVLFPEVGQYAGSLSFDAILRDTDGRVLAWGAWEFRNEPNATFSAFTADRDAATGGAYREGEIVKLTAGLAGVLTGKSVQFEFRDSFGRLLDERQVSAATNLEVTFTIRNALPARMYEVTAQLLDGGREIDRLRTEVRMRPDPAKWPRDDFLFGIWTGERVREYLWPEFAQLFRKMHLQANIANQWRVAIDFQSRYGFEPTLLSGAGLERCSEPEEFSKTGDKMTLVRKPCLSDPAFFAKKEKDFSVLAKRIANIGLRFIWFGDEQSITGYGGTPIDFCFSPHCLTAFREFLKQRYGTLDRLNTAWETDFKDWDSVLPFTRQEVWAEGGERHVAGWADHLEFMDGRLANSLYYAGKLLRAGDSNISTSISGTQPPTAYGGMDWWKQVNVLGGALSYGVGGQFDIHRSFKPEGEFMPWNWGYSRRGADAVAGLWLTVFNGCKGIFGFHDLSIINPDWTWSNGYRDVKPHMDRVASGTGKHLMNNLAMKSQVAILYSQASIRASFFENRMKEHNALCEKYIQLLRHLGYAFDFVSYEQLVDGTFKSRGYKALILADACAMSDAEVAAVKHFAEKGGIVLAEGIPAHREGNCRPRKASPLVGCVKILNEKPCNDYLKALDYPNDTENAESIAKEQDRLEQAFSTAGINPPRIVVSNAETGTRFRLASIWPREGRQGELFWGVISDEKRASRLVDVTFPKKGHLYDLVSGKKIGYGDRFRLPLAKGTPYAFELVDTELPPLAVTTEGATVRIACSPNADTVVQMTVYDPSQTEVWYYSRKILVRNGKAEMTIPFAKSDVKGAWRIVATDVLTGESRTVKINR